MQSTTTPLHHLYPNSFVSYFIFTNVHVFNDVLIISTINNLVFFTSICFISHCFEKIASHSATIFVLINNLKLQIHVCRME